MNIYNVPKQKIDSEITNILTENENIRIERIISQGQTTHWYDQVETEFVCLAEGAAMLEFEEYSLILQKGDTILIPKHKRHRVSHTSSNPKCVWLCVFYQ